MWIENLDELNWLPSYVNGKPGITGTSTSKRTFGLYFIRENGKTVYIGQSKYNVKKVLYRHFQAWNKDRMYNHYRVKYPKEAVGYHVAILELLEEDVDKFEICYIKKHQPRDNKKMYENVATEWPF